MFEKSILATNHRLWIKHLETHSFHTKIATEDSLEMVR